MDYALTSMGILQKSQHLDRRLFCMSSHCYCYHIHGVIGALFDKEG